MNTAGRLLSIYDRLTGQGWPQDKPMVWIWAEIFEIPHSAQHVEDCVVTCLLAMRAEIDLLRSKLLSLGVSDDLTHPGLPRLRNATSTIFLNSQWNGIREETSKPENRIPILWANWALRNEDEADLPAEELAALRGKLDALETSLQDTEMTSYLRSFVQRQIDVIRTALRVYRVQGVMPIEQALQQIAGAYTIEKTRVEAELAQASEPAKNLLARVGALIKDTADVADRLDKIRKAGVGAYTLAASVGPILLAWGQNLLK